MGFYLWLEGLALFTWVREAPTVWGFPTVLTLHTFSMSVLVGASVVLSLRILGVGATIPLAPLRSLFPMVWVAWWVSLATGLLLFGGSIGDRFGRRRWLFVGMAIFGLAAVGAALSTTAEALITFRVL